MSEKKIHGFIAQQRSQSLFWWRVWCSRNLKLETSVKSVIGGWQMKQTFFSEAEKQLSEYDSELVVYHHSRQPLLAFWLRTLILQLRLFQD